MHGTNYDGSKEENGWESKTEERKKGDKYTKGLMERKKGISPVILEMPRDIYINLLKPSGNFTYHQL
jgi:hypothetical protein